MFFDLNVPAFKQSDDQGQQDWLRFEERSLSLGWGCVAVSTRYRGESLKRPSAETSSSGARESDLRFFHPGKRVVKERGRLLKLSRVNLSASQMEENMSLIPKCRKLYDLISCEPTSEETFRKICTLVDCDIISIDFSLPLPFRMHPGHVSAALKRGLVFEISYSKLLQDETTRRNAFSGARSLCRCTRGKGVIISSGTKHHLDLRSPWDIANIATLFDLKGSQAKQCLERTCRALVDRVVRNKFFQRGFSLQEGENEQGDDEDDNDEDAGVGVEEKKKDVYGKKRQKI